MTESFYDVLGVAEDATTDEIETAYRERLKETHPDVSDDEDASQATKTLIEARDVLVDEDERQRYDRLGHDAYVNGGPAPTASQSAAGASGSDTNSDGQADSSQSAGDRSQSRTRREQRASERVRQERQRAREARQQRRQSDRGTSGESDTASAASAETNSTDRDTTATNRRRAGATDTSSATAAGDTYSVREDVATTTSHGPLLPRGRKLTMLGIFFPLYPVLLFSALLPAFPLFVNLVLGACTLLLITYLQSMPRVALLLFGGWSGISLVVLAAFGIGYFSALGLIVLAGTVFPFGFSVLTASALRY